MSKPEHSPLPWKYGDACDLLDAHGNVIAMMDESDARLIIAALESHSALLAAAKSVVNFYEDFEVPPSTAGRIRFLGLEAAIAKAEEATE